MIVNPAGGRSRPILFPLNKVFNEAGVEWDVSITRDFSDAQRLARKAVDAGADIVALYGGDGTLVGVASALAGRGIPMAVLPGGSGNVVAHELGISGRIENACRLFCGDTYMTRFIDLGKANDNYFLLRLSLGFEAQMVKGAERELKSRYGSLAYAISAFHAFNETRQVRYFLKLDGEEVEAEGLTCIIANSGNLGFSNLSLAPNIDMSDGLLDVIVVRNTDVFSAASVAANVLEGNIDNASFHHWQVRRLEVRAEPPQVVQCDGEIIEGSRFEVEIIPSAVEVIVPQKKGRA